MSLTSDAFARLSSRELYDLHAGLFKIVKGIHDQMLDEDGKALIPTMGDQWAELDARHADVSRTMYLISGVLQAREEAAVAANA